MHEEMSRENVEQRWEDRDQDATLKLRELSVDTAGSGSCQGISRCHKSRCRLPGGIDNLLIPSLHAATFPRPGDAAMTFLCKELLCCQEQVTAVPVWQPEVTACDWKWKRRISGPVEGECGIPRSGEPAGHKARPAPSVSHLLNSLGAPVNLHTSHSY